MSEKFLANRLKFHTASRVGAKEDDPLLNALNRDQHTVHYKDVWTSPITDFPVNTSTNTPGSVGYNPALQDFNFKTTTDSTYATDNLIAVFKSGATSTDFKGGKIWTNNAYPAVALYEQVEMTPVVNSNGTGQYLYESYEVLDNNNIRLMDWVSPLAVFDPELDTPVPGYAGKIEVNVKNTTTWTEVQKSDKVSGMWAAKHGNWEFVYSAGMAIFNADYTPTRYASSFTTYGGSGDLANVVKLRWTGFLYTGSYLDSNVALHDKQIKNMFAGATLPDSTNINNYTDTGITRITNLIAGTKPPVDNCAGFLQVMDVDHDDDTTTDKTKRKIRQIIYPDNKDDATPYSRVGIADTLTGIISWSDWAQMGGGSLRRVVVPNDTTTTVQAKNNTLYEAFRGHSFVLPNPSTVPVGTRIGVEQFSGESTITCDTYSVVAASDNVSGDFSNLSPTDAISYIFECYLKDDGTGREWILDVDHNYASAIDTLNDRIVAANDSVNALSDHVDAIDLAAETLLARQTKHMICANDGYTLTSTSPTTANKASDEAWQTFLNSNKFNLYFYDLICSVTVGGKTVTLPNTTVPGACVTVEIIGGLTCTVKTADGSVTQSFTADANTILVLEFEYTRINASTNGWTLLSMA